MIGKYYVAVGGSEGRGLICYSEPHPFVKEWNVQEVTEVDENIAEALCDMFNHLLKVKNK